VKLSAEALAANDLLRRGSYRLWHFRDDRRKWNVAQSVMRTFATLIAVLIGQVFAEKVTKMFLPAHKEVV
jgi:hypothetical protein